MYPYGEKYVVAVLTLSNAVALIGIFFFLSRFTSALFALVGIIFIAIGQSGFAMVVRAAKAKLNITEIPGDEPPRIGGERKLQIFRWGGAYFFQFIRELWFWRK